jgi:hypothetical protein
VCDALGIGWTSQFEKIKGDEVLSSTVREIRMVAADGKKRVQTMLPIEFANGWLFTKIKDDAVLSQAVAEWQHPRLEAIRRPPLPKWQRCALMAIASPRSCSPSSSPTVAKMTMVTTGG